MYTLDDYEKAKAEARKWTEAFDRYSGNNPNKYQSDIKQARVKLREIEQDLKRRGVLMTNDKEKLEAELDKQFPEAKSKQSVEYKGNRYQRKYFPLEKSRSGKTVTEWGKTCIEIPKQESSV